MFIRGLVHAVLGILTGYLFIGFFPNLDILSVIIVIITSIFASVISTLLITFIGLISFFVEDSGPFYWLYSKFILVLGTIFPIEYFPSMMQKILNFSPVYVVSYGPAKLFVDFSYDKAAIVLTVQIVYIFLAYSVCYFTYRKGVKRINVNGG